MDMEHRHPESNLNAGTAALNVVEASAHEKAALEAEAAARLRSHRLGLEGIDAELAAKQVSDHYHEYNIY